MCHHDSADKRPPPISAHLGEDKHPVPLLSQFFQHFLKNNELAAGLS